MLNPSVHHQLLALGYAHTHHAPEVEDRGGPESGPMISFFPAFDEYETADHRIIVDHEGHVVDAADRDLEWEAYCEERAKDDSISWAGFVA